MSDLTEFPDLPEAEPLPTGPAPWFHRLLGRPWPLIDVLVLSTSTCPLCDAAKATLERFARRLGLRVRHHRIDAPSPLHARYRNEVPVIFVAGRRHAVGRVDPQLLARQVAALRRRGAAD